MEFFVARIRNKNTRAAYDRAVMQFFDWCEDRGLALHDIEPIAVSAAMLDVNQRAESVRDLPLNTLLKPCTGTTLSKRIPRRFPTTVYQLKA